MRFIQALESRLHFDGGMIDPTFGTNGTATGDISTVLPSDWAADKRWLTQDSGGRIYAMVYAPDSNPSADGPYKLVISRFSRDGQLDTRFNGSGYKVLDGHSLEGANNYNIHIFVDPNNHTYVMDGPVIWRLTPGGRVDQTFGRKGKIIPPLLADDPDNRLPLAMAFDSNGRAYVGGSATGNKHSGSNLEKNGTRMAVIRLSENGAWDTTWGYQGIYKSPVSTTATTVSSDATVDKLRFLPDGKLAVVGRYHRADAGPNYPNIPAVHIGGLWATRLDPGGNVDTTYGTDGYAQGALAESSLSLNPDGSIIGFITINPASQDSSGGSNFRIEPDGKTRVDNLPIAPSSFAQQFGIKKIDGPIAVQSNGDIVARRGTDAVLFRSNLDNTIDTSFGNNGFATFSDAPLDDVQLAPDGSFITISHGSIARTFNLHRLFRDDAPLAQLDAPFVRAPRTTAIRIAVTYRDDDGMQQSSIGSGDLRVTGPFDGATRSRSVSIESVTPLSGGRFLAIYKLTSPNGWSAIDNGYYTVRLNGGEVEDINGVAAAARSLGTFRVKIT